MYLNCHTYFSLKYGTLSPKELVEKAAEAGVKTIVLTDINVTSAVYDFLIACQKQDIRPVVGIEFRDDNDQLLYIGLAKNNKGFLQLNQFLTDHSLESSPLPERAPQLAEAIFIYPFQYFNEPWYLNANEFIGIRPGEFRASFLHIEKSCLEKYVALCSITFEKKNDFELHKLLRAMHQNTLLSKLDTDSIAKSYEFIQPESVWEQFFENVPELIHNTKNLIASCHIDLDLAHSKNRKTFTGSKRDDNALLEKLTWNGFAYRYGHHPKAKERVKRELRVIFDLGFTSYFLITWDIIRYAQQRGYHHVGRGSGANSIVAYCLKITDVDPIEIDLYFERFINPQRTSPPDFDIDFSWDERDDVIDYIFKRYGRDHVALLATYNTFKLKAPVREIAKCYGLPKSEIDVIINDPIGKSRHHGLAEKIIRLSTKISFFPNYLSIHAGGLLITEEPINQYTSLQLMPKGFPITHFDMHVAEDWGFSKYDILSQRGLGHIKMAADIIRENQGKDIDVHDVNRFKKDPEVKAQLKRAKTIGCFYIESPAMRGLLSKLKCDNYISLVAASSIIRPGVAKSGMMREYIKRFHDQGSIQYLHPIFEEHLKETYGVMVYQEDVIKIAHYFAGVGLDDADILRRAMSGKTRGMTQFEKVKQKYFSNCKAMGYPDTLTNEVWRQMESFSGYSFCKAHSASYAVESFQSLFLKTYFPLEFMVAVINNFGGFYSTELYIHEARMAGGFIHAPCVNRSYHLTSIAGKNIYLGFVHIKDLESGLIKKIIEGREQNGRYLGLEDFIERIPIGREQLNILIRLGAFRFTGKTKQMLLWEKNAYLSDRPTQPKQPTLFRYHHEPEVLPQLDYDELEDIYEQIDLLGYPLVSPFEILAVDYPTGITAEHLGQYINKQISITGYFVTRKNVHTVNKKLMCFGTFVDIQGEFFDTTHFPPSLAKFPFQGKGCYLIEGKVVDDFGFCSIEVSKMTKLPFKPDPRYAPGQVGLKPFKKGVGNS